jgi:hypothetical protein
MTVDEVREQGTAQAARPLAYDLPLHGNLDGPQHGDLEDRPLMWEGTGRVPVGEPLFFPDPEDRRPARIAG